MKIPEPLFAIINPVMRALLRSPLHGIVSDSLMLITFTGRKSGRTFTTPVRYVECDGVIRCFTSREIPWWRNLRGGADVTLTVQGRQAQYHASVIEGDPEQTRKWLVHYLSRFPQDAAYHDIRLQPDKSLVAEDLVAACNDAIVVEARPIRAARTSTD